MRKLTLVIAIVIASISMMSCQKVVNAADESFYLMPIPLAVTATKTNSTEITVKWTAPVVRWSEHIVAYKVYAGYIYTGSGNNTYGTLVATISATDSLIYINKGLTTGDNKFYYVTSTDGTKESNKSNCVSVLF